VTTRRANAEWRGDLKSGEGELSLGSGRYTGPYTFVSRFESGEGGTNPEELIAAAHAACFSMALSNMLAQDGTPVDSVRTEAEVELGKVDDKPAITRIHLTTRGKVPGLDDEGFRAKAEAAKDGCPVSKLYAGGTAEITLDAALEG
jgi:osmotically inducible protein OsmC